MSKKEPETFAQTLRRLRTAGGLSYAQLAALAGLSRQFVRELEVSGKEPSLATAQALARALGVSVEAFGP